MSAPREPPPPFRVLLFADGAEARPAPPRRYDLVMRANLQEELWAQIAEMIDLAGGASAARGRANTEITAVGAFGLKSVERIRELAAHASVVWRIDEKSVESASAALAGCARVVSARGE